MITTKRIAKKLAALAVEKIDEYSRDYTVKVVDNSVEVHHPAVDDHPIILRVRPAGDNGSVWFESSIADFALLPGHVQRKLKRVDTFLYNKVLSTDLSELVED